MELSELPMAREIVVSAHEATHAVVSIRLELPFTYVTLGDDGEGPRVDSIGNVPDPIPFYRGSGDCCGPDGDICNKCRAAQERAEAWITMAVSGSIGVRATGCALFGYGHDADKAYVIEVCRIAFGDRNGEDIEKRISAALDRALALLRADGAIVSAVARELRQRRKLTEDQVRAIVNTTRHTAGLGEPASHSPAESQ